MSWVMPFIYELLTSLRFWAGLTILLSVVPTIWSMVSQASSQPQTIIVGQPPAQQVNITPLINMAITMMVMMMPFILMRFIMGRD